MVRPGRHARPAALRRARLDTLPGYLALAETPQWMVFFVSSPSYMW